MKKLKYIMNPITYYNPIIKYKCGKLLYIQNRYEKIIIKYFNIITLLHNS